MGAKVKLLDDFLSENDVNMVGYIALGFFHPGKTVDSTFLKFFDSVEKMGRKPLNYR